MIRIERAAVTYPAVLRCKAISLSARSRGRKVGERAERRNVLHPLQVNDCSSRLEVQGELEKLTRPR
jgi:hypothetical protein